MIFSEFINKKPSPLDINYTVENSLDVVTDSNFTHFPVLEENIFIGNVAIEDLETYTLENNLKEYKYNFEPFFVKEDTTWMDVLENFSQNKSNITPVLSANNQYLGFYSLDDVVNIFTETPFVREQGAVIIVKKSINDYSIAQISQIVESNNAKILGIFVSNSTANEVEVTIKITISSLNPIIQSFRRYNYEIISEHQDDNYLQNLKERSDYLEKYLNI
ncbi:MAG: CBS domain-containing protein [Flavobacterium sp.]|jgi:CBS domain containing-hemolysin-like protein